ncbi:hypothetical protein L211DRAFT_840153, partial [Terfezia boudieri ATCC MYA-4762]
KSCANRRCRCYKNGLSNLSALAERTQVGLLDNNNNPEDDPEEMPIDLELFPLLPGQLLADTACP